MRRRLVEEFGAERVVVTSASSKAALGLAHLLRRRGVPVTGCTSGGNGGFIETSAARVNIADVSHITLHKPFAIPPGGGGPGASARRLLAVIPPASLAPAGEFADSRWS